MFGKKKAASTIDKDQLELIKNAQHRIREKKGLLTHFIIFSIGAILLICANLLLGIGIDTMYFGLNWWVFAVSFWALLLIYHAIKVLITNKLLSKAWEDKQLEKLVTKQQLRIEALKKQLPEDYSTLKKEIGESQNITLIVAAAENEAIGKNGALMWHLKEDLQRFKKLTTNHFIIMGRKTFESFPNLLPNRKHVVITRQKNYEVPKGVFVVHSLKDALELTKSDAQPFIIGGSEVFKEGLNYAQTIELTRVHETFNDADAFFTPLDATNWLETSRTFHEKDAEHDHNYSFITYKKLKTN